MKMDRTVLDTQIHLRFFFFIFFIFCLCAQISSIDARRELMIGREERLQFCNGESEDDSEINAS